MVPDKVSTTIIKDVGDLISKPLAMIFSSSLMDGVFSTVTSMICITDSWYGNVDYIQLNLIIYLDLRNAFDTVDHTIMIDKLIAYDIKGSPDQNGTW